MSYFQFIPEQFLEVQELQHIFKFLSTDGYVKNILDNSVSFGLVKSNANSDFQNGLVSRDTDSGADKTLKINPLFGVDSEGKFLYSPNTINQIVIPSDGNWYWVKAKHKYSPQEQGIISVAANGDVVGVGTSFTTLFRGGIFPTKIKFLNAVDNTLEYTVLSVIDDTHCIIGNPAADISGLAEFAVESDLTFAVVSTTTPGVPIFGDKNPYQYDSMEYELIEEVDLNTAPTYVAGKEFYLCRAMVSGSDVVCQDKRLDYWETKGSELSISIDRNENPLVGVEAVKWQVVQNPADKNIVEVAWGMRSDNWSINSSTNTLTISSGNGGIFKDVTMFTDNDFDGWRVYVGSTGRYSNVVSSVKVGGAINLILDQLDPNNYTTGDGVTPIAQTVLVTPNSEEIQFWCQSDPADNTPSVNETFTFPINDLIGRMDLEVYKSIEVLYNIQYRYKSFKEWTAWKLIPSDTDNGYYAETSFNNKGVLGTPILQTYTQDPTDGFIALNPCPWSYGIFQDAVFKGDKIGVNEVGSFADHTYIVGTDKNYQRWSGTQTVSIDTVLTLSTTAVEGNEFRFHFDCDSIDLGANSIYIKSGTTVIKQFTFADAYAMQNIDNGVVFTCKFDGTKWVIYQNYELGTPQEIRMVTPGQTATYFDSGTGWGKVQGWFGWKVYDALEGRTPVGAGSITETSGTYARAEGDTGGQVKYKLITSEIPAHDHSFTSNAHTHGFAAAPHIHTFTGTAHNHGLSQIYESATQNGIDTHRLNTGQDVPPVGSSYTGHTDNTTAGGVISSETVTGTNTSETVTGTTDNSGGDGYHENMMPWLALTFAQKQY